VDENVVTREAEPADSAEVDLKLVMQPRMGTQQGKESRHPPR
jgi:hypothetical protein